MTNPIRVLLADDHPPLRVGLRVLLEQAPGIVVVGETGDGREALALIEALRPEVAVLDCELPGLEGPAVAAEVQRRGLPTRVLALSAYSHERCIRGMLEAGRENSTSVVEESPLILCHQESILAFGYCRNLN